MAAGIDAFLAGAARGGLLPWSAESEAAARFGLDARIVEEAALDAGILPSRYARNAACFGLEGQRLLHAARVVVVGCGGLGGHIVENLARLGFGTVVAVDPDVFDESNLNRQLLSTIAGLGKAKVEAAAERVAAINPVVRLVPVRKRLCAENADEILKGADAVADGLDSIQGRLEAADACSRLGLHFVHAGVAGWYGQASTQPPGGSTVRAIYGATAADRGAEVGLGNQAFAPAFAAAIETAELCKIVLAMSPSLVDRLLTFDLLAMEMAVFPLGGTQAPN
jgi:molybdopterin/thiamine biosynthesis adenylyltransferase